MSRIIKAKTLITKGTKDDPILIDLQYINTSRPGYVASGHFRVYSIERKDALEYPEILGFDITLDHIKSKAKDKETRDFLEQCELHEIEIHI